MLWPKSCSQQLNVVFFFPFLCEKCVDGQTICSSVHFFFFLGGKTADLACGLVITKSCWRLLVFTLTSNNHWLYFFFWRHTGWVARSLSRSIWSFPSYPSNPPQFSNGTAAFAHPPTRQSHMPSVSAPCTLTQSPGEQLPAVSCQTFLFPSPSPQPTHCCRDTYIKWETHCLPLSLTVHELYRTFMRCWHFWHMQRLVFS